MFSKMDQRTFHVCICDFFCADSDHNDNVISTLEMFFLKPITFSYQSCKMVSHNTCFLLFLLTEIPSLFFPSPFSFFIHDKRSVGEGISGSIYNLKILFFFKDSENFIESLLPFLYQSRRKGHIYAA